MGSIPVKHPVEFLRYSIGILALLAEFVVYIAVFDGDARGEKENGMAALIMMAPFSVLLIIAYIIGTLWLSPRGFRNWLIPVLWLILAFPFLRP
jgi:hypothetical protein